MIGIMSLSLLKPLHWHHSFITGIGIMVYLTDLSETEETVGWLLSIWFLCVISVYDQHDITIIDGTAVSAS